MTANKNGFVLKNVLFLLLILSSITFSFAHYYQQNLKILQQSLLLEKHKAAELILYSYFMSNLHTNESQTINHSNIQITYTISIADDRSVLDSRICFDACYGWKLEYDLENQSMISSEYTP